jgi:hypothetical protein
MNYPAHLISVRGAVLATANPDPVVSCPTGPGWTFPTPARSCLLARDAALAHGAAALDQLDSSLYPQLVQGPFPIPAFPMARDASPGPIIPRAPRRLDRGQFTE